MGREIMRKVVAVLPARLGSSRFPGKVLYNYKGHPLLYYVYQSLLNSTVIDSVIIATDNKRVKQEAEAFGAEVVLTSKKHRTGSDRVREVADKTGGSLFLNVQADNFGLNIRVIDGIINKFVKMKNTDFGTLAVKITDDTELYDPNTVKVVIGQDNQAICFSRYPIPYLQDCGDIPRTEQYTYYKHIGIYLFTARGLRQFAEWKRTPLEKAESLEQMRIIENRHVLHVFKTRMQTVSVDSKNDLEKLNTLYT